MKNVLILSVGNTGYSHMAEGYLNFYASEKARIYNAGIDKHALHPVAVEAMAEDNIDISLYSSQLYSATNTIKYDYIITFCNIPNKSIPSNLKWKKVYNFHITDPITLDEDQTATLDKFRVAREHIKKSILHFIGKELYTQTHEEVSLA